MAPKRIVESDTTILTRHPLLKAVLSYCFDRLEALIFSAVTAALVLVWQHHSVHNQIWQETGPHFQDLVQATKANASVLQAITNNIQIIP
jgi:hypothetical protein